MKKITQQELNQKAATGAKITELRPAKPTEDEILSEVARVKVRQDDDFKVLADAIEKTSDGVERVHHELTELRRVKEGTVELEIQRQFDRLIHTIDIRKKTEDGKVRYLKATFLRDDNGDVQRIVLAPGI
jgi:hypothetical protein